MHESLSYATPTYTGKHGGLEPRKVRIGDDVHNRWRMRLDIRQCMLMRRIFLTRFSSQLTVPTNPWRGYDGDQNPESS